MPPPGAPGTPRHRCARTLEGLERGELAALRALLAMHFLLTGQWYQPAPPAAAEGLPAALRALYQAETAGPGLRRGGGDAGGRMSRAAVVCSEPGGSGARKTGGFCGGKQLDNRE